MPSVDSAILQRFYHGTRADLKAGDLIAAGYSSNCGARKQVSWAYLTGTLDAAIWGSSWPPATDGKGSTSRSRPVRPRMPPT